jgi:putative nucleotidyltransferase with HDIG domain
MPALPQFRALPKLGQLYVTVVIAGGLVMLWLAWLVHPLSLQSFPTLLYLAVGTQIAALLPIRWRNGVQTVVDPLLVATGLYAPGAGVGAVAWLATFDGRVPGRTTTWWAFVFNRAMPAVSHIGPSLLVTTIFPGAWWNLPIQTVVYVVTSVAINYLMAARAVSFANGASFWTTLGQNVVGVSTLVSTTILGFSGGILFLLVGSPVGYLMAPGVFGFLLAVRGNVADAQRQTELKDQTLDLAAQALDARDRYTESHSIRVSELAGKLGELLELGDRECELIRTAGSLHDLGKIGIRDDILNKPGPLTEEEWEMMRRHPDIGADMIAQHSALAEVAPLVRHHHERWDGTGYPAGLKGDVIPYGARILSVSDSFDTITGPRLYRRSLMTPIEGVEDISRRANLWYDPNVVDALRQLHGLKPLDVADRPEVPRRVSSLRVLRSNPAFTALVTAIGISSVGDPLTQVATLVSIFARTHDALAVALAFIAQAGGTIVMSSFVGGVADRLPRRPLIVSMELLRAAILVATPALINIQLWLIIPILFVLASINAVVQPARQAAIPALVPLGQIGKANAIVAATTMLAGAIGFGLAGAMLSVFARDLWVLFIADAVTFALAAVLVLGIPSLGGGAIAAPVAGALRRSWGVVAARPHLVVGALAAFLITMSFPALLSLAYRLSPQSGGQTYSVLEVVLSVGLFVGSIAVARFGTIGSMRTVGAGLLLTGVFSLAIALHPSLMLVAAALLIASLGNPIYTVANQTALMEAADASNRGSVMSTRFGLVQTASIAGTAFGGLITSAFGQSGPFAAYGVIGVGLVLLGLFALAAGRSTTDPLIGAAYEEARGKSEDAPVKSEEPRVKPAVAQPQAK